PRLAAPEVVHPEKPPFQEVFPKSQCLFILDANGADIGGDQEGTVVELRVGQLDDPRIGPLLLDVIADRGGRHLAQSDQEVDLAVRVVGLPAAAVTLGPNAGVPYTTDC